MIIAMAGLPGTGKSTLARLLAEATGALVLDKDEIRHALFGPRHVTYTRDQDDLTFDLMTRAAAFTLRQDPAAIVILDGRTFTRAYQQDRLRSFAARLGHPLQIVECRCPPRLTRRRLADDIGHPAANRDAHLHDHLAATSDPINGPKLVITTDQPPAACLTVLLDHLAAADSVATIPR